MTIAVLIVLAGMAAFGPAPVPAELTRDDIKRLMDEQKKILSGKSLASDTRPFEDLVKKSMEYSGSVETGLLSGTVSIKLHEDRIISLSLDINGKPGEKLTTEQLVAGSKRIPWISKLEAPIIKADLSRLDIPPLQIRGLGKCYIEDDSGSARYAVDIKADGAKSEDPARLSLKLIVSNQNPLPEALTEPKIERLKGDRFSVAVPIEVDLVQKADSVAPAPQVGAELKGDQGAAAAPAAQ